MSRRHPAFGNKTSVSSLTVGSGQYPKYTCGQEIMRREGRTATTIDQYLCTVTK